MLGIQENNALNRLSRGIEEVGNMNLQGIPGSGSREQKSAARGFGPHLSAKDTYLKLATV
jgi:hypothetical protein